MSRLSDLRFRFRALFRPETMERELGEEFRFHLEMETKKLIGQGMSAAEAARVAAMRFGTEGAVREEARDSWGIGVARDFLGDLRHALRQFRRKPGFSALGILTLALGLGTTVALSGVVGSVLIRPLPVADEGNLRVLWSPYDWRGVEFDYLKERIRGFSGIAAYSSDGTTLRTDAASSVLLVGVTSAELFDVLGAPPLLGRTFAPGEDRPGAAPVVVLGWGMWQQELGGDPEIIGKRVILDGTPTTVIGVMPRRFYFPTPEYRLWRPLLLDPASGDYQSNGWLVLVGRVRAGVNDAGVKTEVQSLARSLGERFTYPAAWDKTKTPSSQTLREYVVGDSRPALLVLLGSGVLLLLMACANVAALVLARTTDRSHEMTLRAALGAGRGRLIRQIVTESLAFSLLAGGMGLGLAFLGFKVLVASLPLQNGLGARVALDWTAFAGALLLSVVVGLAVAAAPVRSLLLGRLHGVRNERGVRGLSRGPGGIHSLLVSGEAGVAALLIVGALLLIRSVDRLLGVNLGFEPRGVLAIDIAAYGSDFGDEARWRLYRELEARAAGFPGIQSAALISRLPIRDQGWQGTVSIEARADLQGRNGPNSLYRRVTPEYFRTMGIGLVRGRGFEPTDRRGSPPVGVVSESFAAKAWPDMDPLGQRVHTGVGGDTAAITVVGVVTEVKVTSIAEANPFVLYVPLEQSRGPGDGQVLVLKGTGNLTDLVPLIRTAVRDIEPGAAVGRVTTMEQVVSGAMAERLRLRFFLTVFGVLALLLGVVGVYSVVSYSVASRQTEFGVRMALGATPGQVRSEVMRRGVLPVAVGTLLGGAAAIVIARGAVRFLYGVAPADPVSLLVAGTVLLGSGVLASLMPAWRAARVSPLESLRGE